MKHLSRFIVLSSIVAAAFTGARGQISNLTVDGYSSNFTIVTGDTISWKFDLSVGGTAVLRLWYDIIGNGTLDTTVDYNYFTFTSTDGDSVGGGGGPGDQDGLVNGKIVFYGQGLGLAPGKYIFIVSQGASSETITGAVTPLTSPAHTVSGTVTPPPHTSAQWILVQLKASKGQHDNKPFWDVFTDVNGNFTVAMNADTAGNPWQVELGNNGTPPFAPFILNPSEYDIEVSNQTYTGYNFSFTASAAQVNGYIKDENGNPVTNYNLFLARMDTSANNLNYDINANQSTGYFDIGIAAGDLDGSSWAIEQSYGGNNGVPPPSNTTGNMLGYANLGVIVSGDSLFANLLAYTINSTITGQVQISGAPDLAPIMLFATTTGDSGESFATVDSTTGNFSIPVSNRIYDYSINPNIGGYYGSVSNIHAGQSGVVINLQPIGPSQPFAFSLKTSWNLISVPLNDPDATVSALFPDATSQAFAYQNKYIAADTLYPGEGYWLKFANAQSDTVYASQVFDNTVDVVGGWNLIGTVAAPVLVDSILQSPGSNVLTRFFAYDNGYSAADTLLPGQGYWVKVNAAGTLQFMSGNSASKKLREKTASLEAAARNRRLHGTQMGALSGSMKAIQVKQ